jgi:phosphoribosyl 1,2-cyclic phosphodiesterase
LLFAGGVPMDYNAGQRHSIMALKLCVLGSGSSGNCTWISSDRASILIDAGLSGRETCRRLETVGAAMEQIQAVCISHEHNDHTAGVTVLHRRFRIPVYANSGTVQALGRHEKHRDLAWQIFTNGTPFQVGDLSVEPFSVPHDAYDPVGFVVRHGDTKIGVVTDMGVPTALVRERLKGCQAMVVEANHDEQMLMDARRPWHLKIRIRGRQGHLSNEASAQMVAELAGPHLQQVFLAHLSADCNRGDLALRTTKAVLRRAGHTHVKVSLTYPDRESEIWADVPQTVAV